MDAAGLPLGFGYIHIYFDAAICYRSCRNAWEKTWRLLSAAPVIFASSNSSTISSFIPPNTRPFFTTFFPHPLLHPRTTPILPPLSATMAHSPRPTPAPNRHALFHKRQSYVTVSVIANDTDTSTSTDASSHSPFPVAIAIPALVGGMAAAIAAFGFWLWWSKRSKRLKRVSLSPRLTKVTLCRADLY